jgi:hypothetical protein
MGSALLLFSNKVDTEKVICLAEKFNLDVYHSWFNVDGLLDCNSVFLLNDCREIISINVDKKMFTNFDEYTQFAIMYCKSKIDKLSYLSSKSNYIQKYCEYQLKRKDIHNKMDKGKEQHGDNFFKTIESKRLTNEINYIDEINWWLVENPTERIQELKEGIKFIQRSFNEQKDVFKRMRLFFEKILLTSPVIHIFVQYGNGAEVDSIVKNYGSKRVSIGDLVIEDLCFLEYNTILTIANDKKDHKMQNCNYRASGGLPP